LEPGNESRRLLRRVAVLGAATLALGAANRSPTANCTTSKNPSMSAL
jgi:hypothetical protein